jgi:hypothetical protein
MARAKTDQRADQTEDGAPKPIPQHGAAPITETDIARRAYGHYVARGCEHGHAIEDWLDAERELRQATGSATA